MIKDVGLLRAERMNANKGDLVTIPESYHRAFEIKGTFDIYKGEYSPGRIHAHEITYCTHLRSLSL